MPVVSFHCPTCRTAYSPPWIPILSTVVPCQCGTLVRLSWTAFIESWMRAGALVGILVAIGVVVTGFLSHRFEGGGQNLCLAMLFPPFAVAGVMIIPGTFVYIVGRLRNK